MKALIVGLGSMGKRRIRLLKGIDPTVEIIGVDMTEERRNQVEEMGHKTYSSITEAAAEKPDVAFVCTAPVAHYVIIKELLETLCHTCPQAIYIPRNKSHITSIMVTALQCWAKLYHTAQSYQVVPLYLLHHPEYRTRSEFELLFRR